MRKIILIAFTLMLVGASINASAAQTQVTKYTQNGNEVLK